MGRSRLLGKLAGGGINKNNRDDNNVIGDVRFSSTSKGGTSRAQEELLTSMGDGGMAIYDDGVLGDADNSEFGGRQRFTWVSDDKDGDNEDATDKKGGKGKGGNSASPGFGVGAMVQYEALDYDANEQLDDNDVNVGEDEMMDDG